MKIPCEFWFKLGYATGLTIAIRQRLLEQENEELHLKMGLLEDTLHEIADTNYDGD